jgi:amino acid adenylation domain-containing protein
LPEPDTALLHEWLLRAAAATPCAIALEEEDRATSFQELVASATAVAATLRARGVRPGDRVVLVLPKTTEAVAAVFGCLLAGAVCVPIHPRWPADRIAAVVEDCGARLIFEVAEGGVRLRNVCAPADVAQALVPAVPGLVPAPVRGRDSVSEASVGKSADAAGKSACATPLPGPEDAAVILFTSGSTGRPKGVVLSHRAVAAFVRWSATEFGIAPADRIACPSPLGFDLSTFDLFNMALCGATCVLVPENIAWMPRFLVRYAAEKRVTVWYSVPSILVRMVGDGGMRLGTCADLRVVLFAGEVMPGSDVALLTAAVPGAVCANLYGPTETNVVTFYRVPAEFAAGAPPPIGRACPFAEVLVEQSTGELLAGGESLMSGYWNRPDDNARAFVNRDGRLYYRTGDRVHEDPSGNLVFAGRLDRQVKRHGYRIELGEIEAALAGHPAILEVGVVASDHTDKGVLITAFVGTGPSGSSLSLVEVKAHCAAALPTYMVPDRVLFVEAVPRGTRGKIDYSALEKLARE